MGDDITGAASVASFFVSRVDAKIDPKLDALGERFLRGKIGIANSKLVHQRFKQ